MRRWATLSVWAGVAALVGVIATIAVLLGLAWFRGASADDQDRIVRRLPFLAGLLSPTAPVILPTVNISTADSMALLGSPVPTINPTQPALPSATATTGPTTPAPTVFVPPTASPTLPPTVEPTTEPTQASTIATEQLAAATATTEPSTPTKTLARVSTVTPQLTATPQPATDAPLTIETTTFTKSPTLPATAIALATNTPRPSLTPSHTASATPTSTFTPSVIPTETPTNTPVFPALPPQFRLNGLNWEPQKFNNCGPANLVQVLNFFNWRDPQSVVAAALKPSQADKNVSPSELAGYVNANTNGQLRAITRSAGSLDLVKRLLVNRFGVILETGFYDPDEPEEGWIGHYITPIAYDDSLGRLYKLDTLKGETSETYETIDELWRHFNREFIVVYTPQREAELAALMGDHWSEDYNIRFALDRAREQARANPGDAFAWFNLGTSFTKLSMYREASIAFDTAFSIPEGIPYRMLWYQFSPYEAYYRNGNYDRALAIIEATLPSTKDAVEELYYYRGMIRAAQGDLAGALADLKFAVDFNQNFAAAQTVYLQLQSGTFKP